MRCPKSRINISENVVHGTGDTTSNIAHIYDLYKGKMLQIIAYRKRLSKAVKPARY